MSTGARATGRGAVALARALLVALAVACGAVGLSARRADDRCAAAVADAKRVASSAPADATAALARAAIDRCAASQPAVLAAVYLGSRGHRVDALAIARALVRREPGDAYAWIALGRLETDPGRARLALARGRALNPRAVAPQR